MNILIVNDDGIESAGIEILVRALAPYGKIYVSAPISEQSAKSHSITLGNRIEIKKMDLIPGTMATIAVIGTPADATRVGLKVFNTEFDLVVSGINNGPNIAKDVLYSGTVGAAMEAKLHGINAIAFSAETLELDYLYDEVIKTIDEILEAKLHDIEGGVLNVNFPKQTHLKPKGLKFTILGNRYYHSEFIKDTKDNDIYFIKTSINQFQEHENSDVRAFEEGYISITPLVMDRTCYNMFEELKNKTFLNNKND